MANYGWVDPETGERLAIGVSGGVMAELERDGKYATSRGLQSALVKRDRNSGSIAQPIAQPAAASPVDGALNTWDWRKAVDAPATSTGGTKGQSRYDKQMAELDGILDNTMHGGQPQESRVITSADVSAAANSASGGNPAAKERLFDVQQTYNSPENQVALRAHGGEAGLANRIFSPTQFNAPATTLEEAIGRARSTSTYLQGVTPSPDDTRRPFIAGADGKNVAGDYAAGGRYSSQKAGTDTSLDLNYARQLPRTSGQALDSVEQMNISNPAGKGVDWPTLPKSPIEIPQTQVADASQDIKDRNQTINSLIDTGDFPTPPPGQPPQPTPTPTPVVQKKQDDEIYA